MSISNLIKVNVVEDKPTATTMNVPFTSLVSSEIMLKLAVNPDPEINPFAFTQNLYLFYTFSLSRWKDDNML